MKADTFSFKTRSRLIKQLGEQLIKSESKALMELIKNSYDADASKCNVTIFNPESIESGRIIIKDDGEGIDYDTFSKVWLEIGTSHKEDLNKSDSLEIRRTKKYGRLRIGEKGIGRFGVHRLGKKIKVISRKKNCLECVLEIDWDEIENSKYIEDTPIKVIERTPKIFKESTGTKIIIQNLKKPWSRRMARDCARSITSLNSPFESESQFHVKFTIPDSSWLDGLLEFRDIQQYKLFSFDIEMYDNKIISFDYKFTPWPVMKKLSSRHLTINDKEVYQTTSMVYKDGKDYADINLENFKIGKVKFKGVIFDRDTKILSLGLQDDRRGFKRYLDNNGGVRIFRDKMRVFDYGSTEDDWLDLGGRRINMPTKRISKNIILGAVYLDRETSSDLIEQADREGFLENEAYHELVRAIRFAIDKVESLRKTDKNLLRKFYGPQNASEPVITSMAKLTEVVDRHIKDKKIKRKINVYLHRIEKEYESITNSLMKSAGAGLNLIVVIHQIEKIVKELFSMLKQKCPVDLIEQRIKSLSSLVEGYTLLVKNSEKKHRPLPKLIDQSLFNVAFRLEAHKIKLQSVYKTYQKDSSAICSEDHVLNALMNIYDNSIWWLGYSKTKSPTLFVNLSDALPGYLSIIIADNGPGFSKSTKEIIQPFISDKPGGMGIGLHLTDQIMQALGGKLLFPELEIFDIPEEFKKGAIIALAFKKGEK